jgi:hypothetical protein
MDPERKRVRDELLTAEAQLTGVFVRGLKVAHEARASDIAALLDDFEARISRLVRAVRADERAELMARSEVEST